MLQDRKITAQAQIAPLEKELLSCGFFRCHRSYLVNLPMISRVGQTELEMQNGDRIPLSKYRRHEFLDAYARQMGVRL